MASVLLTLALLLAACDPKTSTIGSELLGGAEVYVADTFSVILRPVAEDSIRTDQDALNGAFIFNLLGQLDDPQFGQIDAATYSRFTTRGNNVEFPADARLEGVSLNLYVINHYGNRSSDLRFSVNELTESLPASTARYQFDSAAYDPTNLAADFTWRFPHDTAYSQQEVAIPLSATFGEKLLKASASVYATPEAFQEFFRGLRISATRTNPTETGVVYVIDLNEVQKDYARIRLSYRTDDLPDSLQTYDFVVPSRLQHFHSMRRSAAGNTVLGRSLADTAEADFLAPLQCGQMVKLAGRLGDLKALQRQPVNRALLTLSVDKQYIGEHFAPPTVLSIYEALPDDSKRENGLLRIATATLDTTDYTYTFNVTDYVRDLALGNSTAGFVVLGNRYAQFPNTRVPGTGDFLQRAVFGGHRNEALRPRLKLYITRVSAD